MEVGNSTDTYGVASKRPPCPADTKGKRYFDVPIISPRCIRMQQAVRVPRADGTLDELPVREGGARIPWGTNSPNITCDTAYGQSRADRHPWWADSAMREVLILEVQLIVTPVTLARPGGARSVIADSLLLKHQQIISSRSHRRARP